MRRRRKLEVRVVLLSCVLVALTTFTLWLGDIILFEGYPAVYKHATDLIFYLIGNPEENELILQMALSSFYDAVNNLLRTQVEKRAVLEYFDLVMLCLDETIDDG